MIKNCFEELEYTASDPFLSEMQQKQCQTFISGNNENSCPSSPAEQSAVKVCSKQQHHNSLCHDVSIPRLLSIKLAREAAELSLLPLQWQRLFPGM